MSKFFARFMQMFTKRAAVSACGAASQWCIYQPKEPKNIYK